jgi:predicted RNase H-like HicB family nuclease
VQQEPGGGYIASVPNLPGATASGPTLQAAENSLGAIIDALA